MSDPHVAGRLVGRILSLHELFDSMHVRHQFGGAIALAWYRTPRATIDIDVNITLAPEHAQPVLGAIEHLGVSVSDVDRYAISTDGQARLAWGDTPLDVFFATLELHVEMAERARVVRFASSSIPILSPEDLIICKAIFSRPKDWVDIESMLDWGTEVDASVVVRWINEALGPASPTLKKLEALLSRA